jgi:hypothetical protein
MTTCLSQAGVQFLLRNAMGEPLNRSNRIFVGPPVSFEEAFPGIEDVTVEFTEYAYGTERRKGTFSIRRQGAQMRCSNDRCYRGGYEFDFTVHEMIHKRETHREIEMRCEGDEGTPKRRIGRSCDRSIKGRITIKPKSSAPTEANSPS